MSDKPGYGTPTASPGGEASQQQSSSGSAREQGQDGEERSAGLRPALQKARHALEEGVERQAQHLQERARNTGEQISQALGAAADTLSQDQSWLAGPAQDLAQGVSRLTARGLGSPREMKARVTDFARRHPAWALAGAVAVGFVAARFLKAGAEGSEHHGAQDQGYAAGSWPHGEQQQEGERAGWSGVTSTEPGGPFHG